MNIRRLILDVGKGINRPTLIELSESISSVKGVEGVNIIVTDMDIETMGVNITIEGNNIDYDQILKEIEEIGAVVHSIDEIAVGSKLIENIRRDE
ncbi:MAG: DUF211 domain-containing protein [Candidatus Thermoplasmatota archaeon]|nr:DUF211 domain-containing protein [Candidatus Thermoplasmatota archaeon]